MDDMDIFKHETSEDDFIVVNVDNAISISKIKL